MENFGLLLFQHMVTLDSPHDETKENNKIPLIYRRHSLFENYNARVILYLPRVPHLQCDQKKSPNLYKSCPKTISVEKLQILTPLQKLPKNVGDLGKLIVAKGLKNLPKVQ